ncbi:MAG: 2-C-methyl-D-erythritol 2,4-cyclodiphosphate synthase [Muribaculaceae bacterium]
MGVDYSKLPRTGNGFDVHRLVEGRRCIICGVDIPSPVGLLGHSDADVALHALSDALLGALALGDIGKHFPDTDPQWEGADSRRLLRAVMDMVREAGYIVAGADITIMAQKPKMLPHIPAMRANVAADLDIPLDRASVKATTTEGLGFTGRSEGIAALATVLLYPA